uniref:Uncharacterized protein n=1 Tax=Leersia perrieri TaxID=77586 RepID=A0A0D9VE86_9ORYZ
MNGGGGAIAGGDRAVLDYQYYYHAAAAAAGGGLVGQEMMGVAATPSTAAADDGVVLLMEMLDEEEDYYSPAPAANVVGVRDGGGDGADRLSRVMRSLEAEIGGGSASETAVRDEMAGVASDVDGGGGAGTIGRMEDMFSDDLDDGWALIGYGWPPELAAAATPAVAAAHEVGGWWAYSDNIEHLYYRDGDGDCSIDEQVYSALWNNNLYLL